MKPGASVGLWSSARSGSPGSAHVASTYPTSARGSPKRADLPVEHREDLAADVDDAVPEAEVAVDDRALGLLRDVRREHLVHAVDHRELTRLRRLELRVPPLELTADELVASREVAEPDRIDVDRVQLHERVDQRIAGVRPGRLVELRRRRSSMSLSTMPATYDIT